MSERTVSTPRPRTSLCFSTLRALTAPPGLQRPPLLASTWFSSLSPHPHCVALPACEKGRPGARCIFTFRNSAAEAEQERMCQVGAQAGERSQSSAGPGGSRRGRADSRPRGAGASPQSTPPSPITASPMPHQQLSPSPKTLVQPTPKVWKYLWKRKKSEEHARPFKSGEVSIMAGDQVPTSPPLRLLFFFLKPQAQ